MSCLSITGPDAHIHLLRLPGTAEYGLAEALIITLTLHVLIQALRCLLMLEEEGEGVRWMIPHRSGHGEG